MEVAERVDDPVVGAELLSQGRHHVDRPTAPAVVQEELDERHRRVDRANDRIPRFTVGPDRRFHVATLLEDLGEALHRVAVVLGRGVPPQFVEPAVAGQEVSELVAVVDRCGLAGAQRGDRLVAARAGGGFDEGGREEPFGDVRLQQVERLRAAAVASAESGDVPEGGVVLGLCIRADEGGSVLVCPERCSRSAVASAAFHQPVAR
ncbi:hypothetical protein AB0442_16495 [Kitasatospora sp. NPDC085895]|uniref:hypothetical protein n=1 Tax=Kitasatospora sp. NPDC085895 TaxID=3155057 RepID=UPI00344FC263